MNRAALLLAIAAALGSKWTAAADLDPIGFYVGGAVGQSQVRANLGSLSCGFNRCAVPVPPVRFLRRTTGWEAIAGVRPFPYFGAEAQYIDFGSSGTTNIFININRTANIPGIAGSGTTHPSAAALFAVGYLPVTLPYLDVYAKAGVAELRSNINFSGVYGVCAGPPVCDPVGSVQSSVSGTSVHPAFGAGLQIKLGRFALRTEYERIIADTGDPALLAIGVSWMF